MTAAYVISQIAGWLATAFRAGGMLAKDVMMVKWLVSIGNLGWAVSGLLTENVPLVVSNVLCLAIMAIEIIRNKKEKNNGSKTPRTGATTHQGTN